MSSLNNLRFLATRSTDPYHNLALEEYLLRRVEEDTCLLYLWQNQRTVVIGRNQNAENECRIQALEADGGHLARRLSGGGAVYHDLGNLNFTFLSATEHNDPDRQSEVILQAVRTLGIQAQRTGRNDLTINGEKFSGHAFYHTGSRSYHHGTLMVQVDKTVLSRYLNVSPLKLQAKGVRSVRSRVCNLTDYVPDLTVDRLARALLAAFACVYALPVSRLEESDLDTGEIERLRTRYASPEWRCGSTRPLAYSREARYDWGTVRLDYSLDSDGRISRAAVYSDSLDADFFAALPDRLTGCSSTPDALRQRLLSREDRGDPARVRTAEDLISMLRNPEQDDWNNIM